MTISQQDPIVVERLTRSYGTQRGIVDVDFSVAAGEIFGFLGPNGAGKTTTIRVLMGLLRPTAGRARIFGRDCWTDASEVKGLVGFLPGDMHLYEKWTGNEFLDFFAAFRGGGHPARRRALVERFSLDLSRAVRHLSKGNRQKLGLVQALMHDAPLLILDEPSSGLDPLMQVELLDLLREEQAAGKTVFLSSHALPEVERVADRAGIIRDGRLVAVEDVANLKATRERRMEVMLHAPLQPGTFDALEGVRLLSTHGDGRHVELGVRGELRPLLRLLSDLPVDDVVYGPPDLESVFLHYYGDTGTEDEEATVREVAEVRR
jgi:ABC-2 type transport system ATP-binding protein